MLYEISDSFIFKVKSHCAELVREFRSTLYTAASLYVVQQAELR
jgi:hypothetical protein